ncbi:RsiV family protein [Acinetobacter gyllenbergii]|uniref:RsiV family protein n=1 Tax=Acinetobacter gyllenbergii TaxID=134534 RepID=UPI003F566A23
MKTISKFSVLACAILLAACQPKSEPKESQDKPVDPPVVQQTAEPILRGETVKLQVNLPECKGNTCPDFTVERLQSNFPFIDQLLDQQILEQLGKILDVVDASAASMPKTAEDKSSLDAQAQAYANAFVKIDEELKALSSSHQISLMIKPKILQPKGTLATVVLNSSSYLGGAHGSTSQRYYNFDLTTQKQVQLHDLLLPKQKASLDKLAHEAFKTWIVDSKLATDPKEYEQAWPFQVTDNFLLGEQGLILQYGEYEVGPYVVGLPRLVIPFSELQGVLKPEYLPKIDTPAASTPAASTPSQS